MCGSLFLGRFVPGRLRCLLVLVFGLVSLSAPEARAEVVFDQLGQTYTQDFQDYDGSGHA